MSMGEASIKTTLRKEKGNCPKCGKQIELMQPIVFFMGAAPSYHKDCYLKAYPNGTILSEEVWDAIPLWKDIDECKECRESLTRNTVPIFYNRKVGCPLGHHKGKK